LTRIHCPAPGRNRLEVVVSDRVFVFFAEELLLNEHINRRRKGICETTLEEADGPGVLLAAPNELFLLFALRHVRPDRQGHRHHDRHDVEADEQGSHGVAAIGSQSDRAPHLVALT
jgi:hypothetical protein